MPHFDPPFALLPTLTFALLLAAAMTGLYMRWRRVRPDRASLPPLLWRLTALGLLTLILLNPGVGGPSSQARIKPPFIALLDTSRSMTTDDAANSDSSAAATFNPAPKTTRWQAARRATLDNRTLRDGLESRFQVRWFGFDAGAQAATPDALRQMRAPNGSQTGIGEAITQAVALTTNASNPNPSADKDGPPSGGLLLVSDGRDNGAGFPLDAARLARARGLPVYTFCVGQARPGRDLRVIARRPQQFVALGQTIEIGAEIRDTGIPRTPVRVDLLREGRRVASRQIVAAPGIQDVAFPVVEPRKGFFRYAIACAVASGETDPANNRANVFLSVLDARIRVLLLEGQPSWDAKFLAQTLRADPTVTLDTIYQLTPAFPFALSGSPDAPTLRVPRTLDEMARYDVILLGRGVGTFFDAETTANLKRWVSERGGSLVFLRGRADDSATGLHELEPLNFGPQEVEATRLRLTEAGRSHPGFALGGAADAPTVVQKLPALVSATQVTGEKAFSVVLARAQGGTSDASAPEMALLAYQRYGQGKTLAVVGQGLWRWAFLPPELGQYSRVYAEFWTQTVRWLVSESDFLPGQNLALHTDRTSYSSKDTVNFLGYRRGPSASVPPIITLTLPDGGVETLASAPGAGAGRAADFTAAYRPTQAGEYVATVAPAEPSELSASSEASKPSPPKAAPDPASRSARRAAPALAVFTVFAGQEEDANRAADPALMRQIAATGGGQALTRAELDSLPEKLRAAEILRTQRQEARTLWDRGWALALLLGVLAAAWLYSVSFSRRAAFPDAFPDPARPNEPPPLTRR